MAPSGNYGRTCWRVAMTWQRLPDGVSRLVDIEVVLVSDGEDLEDPPEGAITPDPPGRHRMPHTEHVDLGIVETEAPPPNYAEIKLTDDVILRFIEGEWQW